MCRQYSTKIILKDHQHFGSSDFDGNLRALGSFVCHSLLWPFNSGSKDQIHVSPIATIRCNISLPSSPYIFRSLRAMFTHWCFWLSDSMWGTHRAAIFLICRRSVNIPSTDPWLTSNSWAILSHEYLFIVQHFCNIFHIFIGHCQQMPSAQVLVANCIFAELSYPSGDRTIWKYKLWTYFLERFQNFHRVFAPPSLNLIICYLFDAHQRERTVRHDSFVNDIIFTWRVKLFFPAQILHETLMNNLVKFC